MDETKIVNELYFITNIKLLITFTDLNFISSSALHHQWKLDEL
jgi:hypothetical protein